MDREGSTLAIILWESILSQGQLLGSAISIRGIKTSLEQLYIWWQYTQASTHDS
jgi:hypothetical protein